jgi:hypothetical protein
VKLYQKAIGVLVALAFMAIAGACGPTQPGNPGATAITAEALCLSPAAPPISDAKVTLPVAPAGKRLTQIRIYLYALRWHTSSASCEVKAPAIFDVHMYATANGSATFTAPDGTPLPYDARKTTPYTADLFLTHRDPATVSVTFQAKQAEGQLQPLVEGDDKISLGCAIFDGAEQRAWQHINSARGGEFLSCQATWIAV